VVVINEVELCWAQLVPGWATILGRVKHLCAKPAVGRHSEYQRKLGVNRHTTWCISSYPWSHSVSWSLAEN